MNEFAHSPMSDITPREEGEDPWRMLRDLPDDILFCIADEMGQRRALWFLRCMWMDGIPERPRAVLQEVARRARSRDAPDTYDAARRRQAMELAYPSVCPKWTMFGMPGMVLPKRRAAVARLAADGAVALAWVAAVHIDDHLDDLPWPLLLLLDMETLYFYMRQCKTVWGAVVASQGVQSAAKRVAWSSSP